MINDKSFISFNLGSGRKLYNKIKGDEIMNCKNNDKIVKFGDKIYVLVVYIILPILVTIVNYFILNKFLVEYVSSVNFRGLSVSNSEYTIQKIFKPFISSMVLIISLIVSMILIKTINYFFNKYNEKFVARFNVKFAKKVILLISILIALLSAIAYFYSSTDYFEYFRYGIETKDISLPYLPLKPIPSIQGGNINSDEATLLYQFIYFSANLIKKVEEVFDLIIAMTGVILIPLIIKIERSKSEE